MPGRFSEPFLLELIMAKRFIDTGLFDDNWFSDLSKDGKLAWIYIITKCNHAGILTVSEKLIEFQTGIKSWSTVRQELGNRLISLKDNKYFIPKFIVYQYPKGLSDNVSAQKSAIDILVKYDLYKNSQVTLPEQLANSSLTVVDMDMDMDMDMDKNMDKDKDKDGYSCLIYYNDLLKIAWDQWINYKSKELNFSYKTKTAEQTGIDQLNKLCNGNYSLAINIVNQSIANGWKGLFECKVTKETNNMVLKPGISTKEVLKAWEEEDERNRQAGISRGFIGNGKALQLPNGQRTT